MGAGSGGAGLKGDGSLVQSHSSPGWPVSDAFTRMRRLHTNPGDARRRALGPRAVDRRAGSSRPPSARRNSAGPGPEPLTPKPTSNSSLLTSGVGPPDRVSMTCGYGSAIHRLPHSTPSLRRHLGEALETWCQRPRAARRLLRSGTGRGAA